MALPRSVFDTNLYSSSERIEAYRDSMGVVFDVDNIDQKNYPFQATIESHLIDEIMLVSCKTVAQSFYRTPSKIAHDSMDHFLIQLFFAGFTAFEKKDSYLTCDSSSLVVIDTSRPWKAFNPSFRNLTLVVPKRLLYQNLWDVDSHHGRLLRSNLNPFVELLEGHMLSLYESIEHVDDERSQTILAHAVDLVVSTLNYATYLEKHRQKEKAETFRKELISAQMEISLQSLAELFSVNGITSAIRKRNLFAAYERLKQERGVFTVPSHNEKLSTASFDINLSSSHRLWEQWLLAL